MSMRPITLVTGPLVIPIAEMRLLPTGLDDMVEWLKEYRPECVPEEVDEREDVNRWRGLFATEQMARPAYNRETPAHATPGDGQSRQLSDNELLVELSGRTCYHSYGKKAGRKTNREYIANMQVDKEGNVLSVPHASVLYHAKMSFFIANVSRRVSHELIRNYVGADRDEEGSPSQESTRYTEHPGHYVVPPKILGDAKIVPPFTKPTWFLDVEEVAAFHEEMQRGYDGYLGFIERQCSEFEKKTGKQPSGMDRKKIYEAASFYLHHSVTTSFVWTTNPMALAKLFKERCDELADAEFRRFALKWKALCIERWPNLFPQPWMR